MQRAAYVCVGCLGRFLGSDLHARLPRESRGVQALPVKTRRKSKTKEQGWWGGGFLEKMPKTKLRRKARETKKTRNQPIFCLLTRLLFPLLRHSLPVDVAERTRKKAVPWPSPILPGGSYRAREAETSSGLKRTAAFARASYR